ncbi:CGNR zinc finger domain-containing protein [Roseicyclus sp.]|uniref:CGNR zinc finger domain-containing protein n=1 Tax=Roseicyclus sp. TaxID=1914329 RepID=UPI003F6AA722
MSTTHAGQPILHFLNTVRDDGKQRRENSFADPADLHRMLIDAGLANADHPVPGPAQMQSLLALREAAYAVFSAIAASRMPDREEALMLETTIKAAVQDAQLVFTPGQLGVSAGPLGGIHDRLALALFDLLRADDLARLRECARCTHLFIDHGRGPGRRWCAMTRCGNRAKLAAYRRRQRDQVT